MDVDVDRHSHGGGFAAGVATGLVVGAVVSSPPRGYVPIHVGGAPYYYSGGYYYEQGNDGYTVVSPPVGAIVPNLPDGTTSTVMDGTTCFIYNNVTYKPVMVNGVTQYQVVSN